jgi:hypothetical protein
MSLADTSQLDAAASEHLTAAPIATGRTRPVTLRGRRWPVDENAAMVLFSSAATSADGNAASRSWAAMRTTGTRAVCADVTLRSRADARAVGGDAALRSRTVLQAVGANVGSRSRADARAVGGDAALRSLPTGLDRRFIAIGSTMSVQPAKSRFTVPHSRTDEGHKDDRSPVPRQEIAGFNLDPVRADRRHAYWKGLIDRLQAVKRRRPTANDDRRRPANAQVSRHSVRPAPLCPEPRQCNAK